MIQDNRDQFRGLRSERIADQSGYSDFVLYTTGARERSED